MGFLEGLFGGGRKEKVPLAGLGPWLEGRLRGETEGLLKDARPRLEGIAEIAERLRGEIAALEAAEPHEVHPRYDKIVKTAKPAYVKAMGAALEGLAPAPGGGLDDITAYDRRLQEALDTIGRVGFGDGKLLPYAFQPEMARIQADSRRLLTAREELSRILTSNGGLADYRGIKELHDGWGGLRERARRMRSEAAAQEGEALARGREAARAEEGLARLRDGGDYGRMVELRERLKAAEAEGGALDSRMHSALSPLKSGLRKYGKAVADPAKARLVESLQENPVEAYMAAPEGAVEEILRGFADASRSGSITLKDGEKARRKADAALQELGEGLRGRRRALGGREAQLRAELESLPAAEEERRLSDEGKNLGQAKDRSVRAATEAREKAAALEEESAKALAELRVRLLALGVELEA